MTEKHEGLATSVINLRILAAAVAFASKDETRYYLNGVCLEIDARSVTYIATDGSRLIAYRDEKQDDDAPDNLLTGKFIIPTAHCKPHKLEKDDVGEAKIFGAGRLTIAHDFCDVTFLPIDGIYPDWRKSIPATKASGALGQYNLAYLASFKKFAAAIDLPPPFIAHNGVEAPGLVWFPGRDNVVGIVMPTKLTNELERVTPDWCRRGGDHEQADIEDAA
jgi:DNA polymerase III subunit beta